MEPKVLADALVEAGILCWDAYEGSGWYLISYAAAEPLSTKQVITDWRVAGKVLESMGVTEIQNCEGCTYINERWFDGNDLPRSIIEAWYQATEQVESDE